MKVTVYRLALLVIYQSLYYQSPLVGRRAFAIYLFLFFVGPLCCKMGPVPFRWTDPAEGYDRMYLSFIFAHSPVVPVPPYFPSSFF